MIDPGRVPLALYVHLPWCRRKCPYCDFNSHAVPVAGLPEQAYVDALLDDLAYATRGLSRREFASVFFGGGTPSLFGAASIGAILERANTLVPLARDAEVTLEANPGTVERGRFAEYAAAGVNRVSLGAQSFDDASLAALGRIHSSTEVDRAVDELCAAGLDNFNLDLMYALPGQDVDGAMRDLERALALGPAHVSHYQLTLEPGTPFARRPPAGLPDEDAAWAIQEACLARLAQAGFEHYEVSAHARPGRRCRHNLVYWQYGDYVGVGAGAHGKVTEEAGIQRTVRVRHPAAYLAAAPEARVVERRTVEPEEVPFEFCLNALRLVEGFDPAWFETRTGLALATMERGLRAATERGLIGRHGARWQPTELGRRFLNDLQALFLPA